MKDRNREGERVSNIYLHADIDEGVVVHELVEEESIHQYINQSICNTFFGCNWGKRKEKKWVNAKEGKRNFYIDEKGSRKS